MMTNGNLFSFIFKTIHLNAWRQLIFVVGLFWLYKFYKYYKGTIYQQIIKLYSFFFVLMVGYATVSRMLNGFGYYRLIFNFWIYFSGVPFIIFPLMYKVYHKGLTRFSTIFVCLGLFSSFGILLDYFSGGMFTKFFFLYNQDLLDVKPEEMGGRYYFLSESATVFGLYYCFCTVCVIYNMFKCRMERIKMLYLLLLFVMVMCAFLTGSRQILLAQCIEIIGCFLYYIIFSNGNKRFIIYVLIAAGTIGMPYIVGFMSENKKLLERYDSSNVKEDSRSALWKIGFDETCKDLGVFAFGKGFSYVAGQKANKNEVVGNHYENTFFARISETGIVGLLIFLYPFIFIIRRMRSIDLLRCCIFSFLVAFLIVSFISPNGIHQTSQMVLFICWGWFLESYKKKMVHGSGQMHYVTTCK